VERQTILDHPVLKVEKVLRRQEDVGDHPFLVLDSPPWVNVVAVTPQQECVLIRQWRQGISEETLEIPGGLVDPGETPAQAGARELAEETGYRAARLEPLGRVTPNPALFSNHCHTFLAVDAQPDGPPRPDETEEIEVVTVPVAELGRLVMSGAIHHSLVIAALSFYWLKYPEIAPCNGLK
jgi:8-oxo-dGTP pyrophosphatase MutT (NUDIX family)